MKKPESKHHMPIQKCESGTPVSDLSDIELIAIILNTGTRDKSVLDIANELYYDLSGLKGLKDCGLRELSKITGIGLNKAIKLAASFEIGRRAFNSEIPVKVIDSPIKVWKLVLSETTGLKREEFRVLILNNKNHIIKRSVISVGTISETIIHPREIFRCAIRESGSSIILTHNHPSGVLTPSNEDINATKRLKEAGAILGIALLDHVITSDISYLSMKEEGYL